MKIKKILTNYRYYVMFLLMTVAVLGIFSVPIDEQPFISWLYCLISSKLIGLASGWILYKLIQRWDRMGTIPEFTNMSNDF
ncbi:MAG: hypothetical protein LKI53_02495 [Bacteroidales bacterium]|nr:hypothetical protein [Bacteroidales bacterium]